MIAAMNTPTFPPTGDFTFTDDLRGHAVIQEDLASECFVLRDEHATHVVISQPVLLSYQLGSVEDYLPVLMQSATLALCEDVAHPMIFYVCHAAARNTASDCDMEKLSLDAGNQLHRDPIPGCVAADLIERCFAVAARAYRVEPSEDVRRRLRSMASEGLGANVVRFRR